jgi:hypothetical protein
MSRTTASDSPYQQGSDASCVGPVAGAVDHWEGHLVVPFGCVIQHVRSRGFSVRMVLGKEGLVCTATSTRSRMRCTDWNRFDLASLKSGRLPPSPLSPSRVVNVK